MAKKISLWNGVATALFALLALIQVGCGGTLVPNAGKEKPKPEESENTDNSELILTLAKEDLQDSQKVKVKFYPEDSEESTEPSFIKEFDSEAIEDGLVIPEVPPGKWRIEVEFEKSEGTLIRKVRVQTSATRSTQATVNSSVESFTDFERRSESARSIATAQGPDMEVAEAESRLDVDTQSPLLTAQTLNANAVPASIPGGECVPTGELRQIHTRSRSQIDSLRSQIFERASSISTDILQSLPLPGALESAGDPSAEALQQEMLDLSDVREIIVECGVEVLVEYGDNPGVTVSPIESEQQVNLGLISGDRALKISRIALDQNNSLVRVRIQLPEVPLIQIQGDSRVIARGWNGARDLEIRSIAATPQIEIEGTFDRVDAYLAGTGSEILMTGAATDLEITLQHGGKAELEGLQVKNARVRALGNSQVRVRASDEMDLHTGPDSTIVHFGNAENETNPRQLGTVINGGG